MSARHDLPELNTSDAALRNQAWSEAYAEVSNECWTSILQKCSNLEQEWRDCSEAVCRRSHRCSDGRLICLENRRRRSPSKEMTAEERALVTHRLKQGLNRALAEHEARGEKNDLHDRIAEVAEQKLASLRAARGRRG